MKQRNTFSNMQNKQPVKYRLVGDWNGVDMALKALPVALRNSGMWGQRKAAEKFAKLVKSNIRNGKVQGPAKDYNSSDGRLLINDEDMVGKIIAWRQNGVYYAGIKKGQEVPKRKIDYDYLAIIHEQGLGKMPERKVWGPSWIEFGEEAGAYKYVVQAIAKKAALLKMVGFTFQYKPRF